MSEKLQIIIINSFVSVLISVLVITTFGYTNKIQIQDKAFEQNEIINKTDDIRIVNEESAITDLVTKVDPSVVSIIVSKDLPIIERRYDSFDDYFIEDPFFREFFGFRKREKQYKQNQNEQKIIKREIGGGTGFIITEDGLVVTNKHVVFDDKAEYTILMNNEEKFNAEVIAKDPINDIAVLKIKHDGKRKFSFLDLGDSDSLKVGQTVVAIGNALGDFRNTVSKGVVSGLARDLQAGNGFGGTEYLDGVIQTDAAINQGNSGGPLVNLSGQVVGVNVAVAYGAENIGFSIPINSVKNTITMVKENGKIARPIIGVRYIMITEALKKKNNLSVDYGAIILRGDNPDELAVLPNSPAFKVGLREYDIILELNGIKINQNNTLSRAILKYKVGDTVKLKVISDGKEKIIDIKLIEAPENM